MFSLEFLHRIRAAELAEAARLIAPHQRILEIGGGTGLQAKLLQEMGHRVACIDLAGSTYSSDRVFPVQEFDGVAIPFAAAEFDLVFSSNVLEHVADFAGLNAEIRRVLKPGGRCLHLMPSPAWRLWTTLTHYPNLPLLLWARGHGDNPFPNTGRRSLAHLVGRALWPGRHGETGSMLGEFRRFSRAAWLKRFRAEGFNPIVVAPIGLFYTGNMLLGARLPLAARRRLARWLGSAATLYLLEGAEPG